MQLSNFENIRIADMRKLTKVVLEKHGFDFSNYAMSSLNRRILRVLDLYKLGTVDHLLEKLDEDPGFFQQFLHEVTVNTTEMFRDPDMWRLLRDRILPELSRRRTLRVWHGACSTGEEVFSMGIMLREDGLLDRSRIFASDINREALNIAKTGCYPMQRIKLNAENYEEFEGNKRLSHYYEALPDGRNFQMDLSLMKNTFYMVHDLVKGEPFGKFDLVMVRNVLIYFNKQLQNEVLRTIHANMTLGGYLVLGSKETIRLNEMASKFREVSAEERIYKKVAE